MPLETAPKGELLGDTLGEAIAELERLNRETERAFLLTGGKLAALIESINRMSAGLQAIAELIAGERGRDAARALSGVLELSRGMGARPGEQRELLGMRNEANRMKRTLAQFDGIVSALHSLGLLTRIETARLGKASADFGKLAEDVRLLARNVETRVENALQTAADLAPGIEGALRDVAALQEGQAKELPVVIERVLQSLASFEKVQHQTRDASLRLAGQSAEIAGAFERLIVSMQFQDITRQRLEHVIDVLRRLRSEPGRQGAAMAVVLELQSSQLSHASQKFGDSVATVVESLDEIAGHVVQMAEESRALGGDSGTVSFFQRMEQGCEAILGGFSQCAAADAATRALSESLAAKVARLRASIEEIQTIEAQMRRTAMNAMISAEHLGHAGEALGTLADSIRQKACESGQASEALIEALDSLNAAASRLSGPGRGAAEPVAEARGLDALRAAVAQMRSSQESSFAQIADIAARADALRGDLAEARNGLSIGAEFSESVSRTQGKLRAAIGEMRGRLSGGSEDALAHLDEFAARYTMREQHDIHASVTSAVRAGAEPASGARPCATTGDSEFGENVELF